MSVGPGSTLAGRYTLDRRLAHHDRWERWSAHDATLERDVVLLTFPESTPQAVATLDAARRAAGIEEPRLVRVLDVGSGAGVHYVVEEPLTGAIPLVRLVDQGGLPAEEARRLTGESAVALASAAARGVHHAHLTPRDILVLPDGAVKVRGVATHAALAGDEDLPGDLASRTDVASLVAVLYAGLTGRWPLPDPDAGLEAAPRIGSGVAAPSELAAGVGPDLDRLARGTLNESSGPATPAELAAGLRPWSPVPVDVTHPSGPAGEASAAPAGPADGLAAGHRHTAAGEGQDAPTAAEDGTPEPGPGAAAALRQVGRGIGTALGSAGSAAVGAAGSVAGRVSALARGVTERAGERAGERAERRAAAAAAQPTPASGLGLGPAPSGVTAVDTNLSAVLRDSPSDELGAPAPLVPDELGGSPDRAEARMALAFVAGLLVLLAVIGIWGLPKLGFGGGGPAPSTTPRPTLTGTGSTGTGTAAPGASGGVTDAPVTPVAIVGSSAFEPSGPGPVESKTAARAHDGNPTTMWRSKYYGTPAFGGLPVTGIGLVVDLGQATPVRRVTVTVPAAQDFTVYVAQRATLEGARSLGSSTGRTGAIVFDAPEAVSGSLVIVVVTSLAADGEGHFRAQLAEIQVSA